MRLRFVRKGGRKVNSGLLLYCFGVLFSVRYSVRVGLDCSKGYQSVNYKAKISAIGYPPSRE